MDRSDFEDSTRRAMKARSRTRIVGAVTKDFMWRTGQWHWLPKIVEHVYYGWAASGVKADLVYHRRKYWLSMGWSQLETLREDDPRCRMFHGGNHG